MSIAKQVADDLNKVKRLVNEQADKLLPVDSHSSARLSRIAGEIEAIQGQIKRRAKSTEALDNDLSD